MAAKLGPALQVGEGLVWKKDEKTPATPSGQRPTTSSAVEATILATPEIDRESVFSPTRRSNPEPSALPANDRPPTNDRPTTDAG